TERETTRSGIAEVSYRSNRRLTAHIWADARREGRDTVRKDGHLEDLKTWLKQNPRREEQTLEQRAMEVYQHGIAAYDELDAHERALQEELAQIAEDARFYALLN